jgi:nitroreductase/FMN reductase [NAD(P)H]
MQGDDIDALNGALRARFGEDLSGPWPNQASAGLAALAAHSVHREFIDRPVDMELLRGLCALALSSPSKSDLQQRDIVIVQDADLRARIGGLMPQYPWVATAPAMVIVCLNARRLPQLAGWRGKPFPNDHADLLFNATGDAAIALAWLQAAVDLAGLGGCPVSEIRNHAAIISDWLGLPDKVAPYAGFCLGWPARNGTITRRLPLRATVHVDRFDDSDVRSQIDEYDAARAQASPMRRQRLADVWGEAEVYGWSEDKARQYSEPLRAEFGAYLRARGFDMT